LTPIKIAQMIDCVNVRVSRHAISRHQAATLMYVTMGEPRLVNIGLTDDPFYRYQTRQLVLRVASKNRTLPEALPPI